MVWCVINWVCLDYPFFFLIWPRASESSMLPHASYFFSIRSAGMLEKGLYLLGQQSVLVKAPLFLKILLKVSKGSELQWVVSGTAAEHKLGMAVLTV